MTFGFRVGSNSILNDAAVGRRTERTAPVVPGAVEATAASAREEADDVPSTPAAALGELDYNVMQFNTLRDSCAERLQDRAGRDAIPCHRTAAAVPQKPPTSLC